MCIVTADASGRHTAISLMEVMCSNIRRGWIMSCFSPCADTVTQKVLEQKLSKSRLMLFLDS